MEGLYRWISAVGYGGNCDAVDGSSYVLRKIIVVGSVAMRDKNTETLVGQFFDVLVNIRSRELDEEGKRETLFLSVRIINQLAYKRVCTGLEKQELREFIWQMSDQELDKMMEILYYSPENGVTVIEHMERFLDRVYAEMARKRYDLAAERK